MGRSRYKIYYPESPHFLTCTVLHWIPIFTNVDTVQIVLNSLKYLQTQDDLKIYAYVILENHLHLIAQSQDISKSMKLFKSFTAKEIIKLLEINKVRIILDQLQFYKKAHKSKAKYQLWQEGIQPKLIQGDEMMKQRINYIHQNPVNRGYVDNAEHWRYSSARDYVGTPGLIKVDINW